MIQFAYEDTPWRLDLITETTDWIKVLVQHHSHRITELNYVFCSDDYLLYLNKKYLSHDYYTDILTFNYSAVEKELIADVYISVDRVRENAAEFNVPFIDEMHRVMVHGVLHLLGYDDVTDDLKKRMRLQEDFALSLRMF